MKIAIVTNGICPVPDVKGGAVEHLSTVLLEQNEIKGKYDIDVYTVYDIKLKTKRYKRTNIVEIKNKQFYLPIRIFFSVLNRIMNLLHVKKHYDYMSYKIPRTVADLYDCIVVENSIEIAKEIRKRYSGKLILHLHNDFDTISYDYDKTSENIKNLHKIVDKVIVVSKYLKRHIIEYNNILEIEVLENCINKKNFNRQMIKKIEIENFRIKNNIFTDDFVILFCGRLGEEKGAYEILCALRKLKDDNFLKVKLIIAGDVWFHSRKEENYKKKLENVMRLLEENIIFLGYVYPEFMPLVYASSDLVVVPTQCIEAFGMTALEALTMGKPCIASDCGGLGDIVDDKCGKLIKLDEKYVDNLALSIKNYINDYKEYMRACEASLIRAESFDNDNLYFEKFCAIVDKEVGVVVINE